MALKRALVVDDSKSARLVLRRLLEKYNLTVDTAETGEEALEFLVEQQVDVIFMDHTMPGMDGLQAVSAIKNNPRTAMIPVMMYTAKEGEVYVGQARALGAVGVLPKQVHPAELFKVLEGLGLVIDRRAKPRPEEEPASDDSSPDFESQVQGVALQALVERLLLEQRSELRSDILASHQGFAEKVAEEIFRKQTSTVPDPEELVQSAHESRERWRNLALLTFVPLIIALFFAVSNYSRLDTERAINDDLQNQLAQWQNDSESENSNLSAELSDIQFRSTENNRVLIEGLAVSINRNNAVPFDGPPMNDTEQEMLGDLLSRLVEVGFIGTVRLESHLGEFCLVGSDFSSFVLPDPDTPISDCAYVGHPLDTSDSIAERQSINFANFLSNSPLANDSGIAVEVVAHPRADSIPRYPYPAASQTAGEWNQIAALNHRLEVTLLPENL